MMKTLKLSKSWLLAAVVMLWGGIAWAAGSEKEDLAPENLVLQEVQAVIESQLLAFQSSDGAGAFFHAAPSIKGAFGEARNFMAMVKRGYRVIYDNQSWSFEDSRIQGDTAAQVVLVEDGEGQQIRAVYYLGKLQGRWQITGVQQLEVLGTDA